MSELMRQVQTLWRNYYEARRSIPMKPRLAGTIDALNYSGEMESMHESGDE